MTAPEATDLVGNWLMDKADPAQEADRQLLAAWREIRRRLVTDPSVVLLEPPRRCVACGHEDRP